MHWHTNLVHGTDNKVHPNITCHSCRRKGYYADKCNQIAGQVWKGKITLAHFTLNHHKLNIINCNWILLNTGSTISVCCNADLVFNITPCAEEEVVTAVTNGVFQTYDNTASLKLLPSNVHYNEESFANILSMSDLANLPGAKVTMDSSVNCAIIVHYNNESFRFEECSEGLYFYDTSTSFDNLSNKVKPYVSFFKHCSW